MTPGIRSASRPYATAAPWFPDDAVTTPPALCPGVIDRSLFIAPRSLNEPVIWRFSIFRNTRARPVPPSARDPSTGVSRTYGRMRPSAASISAFMSMNRRSPARGFSRYHDSAAGQARGPGRAPGCVEHRMVNHRLRPQAAGAAGEIAAPARRNLLSYVEALPRFGAREACLWREGVRWRRRTYAELHRRILACAAALSAAGLRRGEPVLIQGPDGADWVEALLGTFWAGGVAVPLEGSTPDDLRARIAARAGGRFLLAPPATAPPDGARRIDFGSWGNLAPAASAAGADPAPEERAEIIFTSGTTGDPKGVILTHGNLISDFAPIERAYRKRERLVRPFGALRFLTTLPLSHMFGQALNVFLAFTMGLTVVFVPPRPRDVKEAARRVKAWGLFTVPRLLDLLAAEVRRALADEGRLETFLRRQERYADRPFYVQALLFRSVQRMFGWRFRLIVSGGAALPEPVDQFFRRSGYLVRS